MKEKNWKKKKHQIEISGLYTYVGEIKKCREGLEESDMYSQKIGRGGKKKKG